jgi:Domain of unknown function (DUF4136)
VRTWIIVVALLVAPPPAFTQKVNVDSFSGGLMSSGDATASVQTDQTGTLVVDLYDARSKQLVGRGTGTGTSSDKPEKNTAKMNKAVAKMFEQYPPTQK